MLQRQDDHHFWQSVTGSLEEGESPKDAVLREVKEETGIDINQNGLTLVDSGHSVEYEIFPQFLHRYEAGVTHNREYWFYLAVEKEFEPELTEHVAYQWLPINQAAQITPSWNNRQAIENISQYNKFFK